MDAVVEIETGRLRGERAGGLCIFRGVPFAAPPVGALRFRSPAPVEPWAGARDATRFGPHAPQPPSPLEILEGPAPETDESCLTLNVWTQGLAGRRPVLVWIHGGGFSTGGASGPLYDGAHLARRGDVVVVSIQYRLGVLGLLAHPALRDPETGLCGNWCLQDQIAALGWVARNIERFGGDPRQVMIFGESAGGASVALLSASPLARGLFGRAIVQSASPEPIAREQAEQAALALAAAAGCERDPEKLRALDVATLLGHHAKWAEAVARGRTAPRPHLDGLLLEDPFATAERGALHARELMVGTCRDEWKLFAELDPRGAELSQGELRERFARAVGSAADAVLDCYRAARTARGQSTSPVELWSAFQTDWLIRVPALRFAELHADSGGRAYSYAVTWESPALGGKLGACHAIELPFVFGTIGARGMDRFFGRGPEAEALSVRMVAAWLDFARKGEPGWGPYTRSRRATMIFGRSSGEEVGPWEPERAIVAEHRR